MKIEKIRKHCEWIIDHFKEINYFDEFTNNEELVYSSAFVLSQIGELANHLSDAFKQQYKCIPWNEMRGIRNLMAHQYHSVDFDIIWETSHGDIAALRQFCADYLNSSAH